MPVWALFIESTDLNVLDPPNKYALIRMGLVSLIFIFKDVAKI